MLLKAAVIRILLILSSRSCSHCFAFESRVDGQQGMQSWTFVGHKPTSTERDQ